MISLFASSFTGDSTICERASEFSWRVEYSQDSVAPLDTLYFQATLTTGRGNPVPNAPVHLASTIGMIGSVKRKPVKGYIIEFTGPPLTDEKGRLSGYAVQLTSALDSATVIVGTNVCERIFTDRKVIYSK